MFYFKYKRKNPNYILVVFGEVCVESSVRSRGVYKEVFVNFLAMISLKMKLMEYYVDLILISLTNTKIGWNRS